MNTITIPYLSHKHKEWLKPLIPDYHIRFTITMKYARPTVKEASIKERVRQARQRWNLHTMVLQ